MVAALILFAVVVLIVLARRRRKASLAGLNSERPVFSVEPPTRRVASRKHEAL